MNTRQSAPENEMLFEHSDSLYLKKNNYLNSVTDGVRDNTLQAISFLLESLKDKDQETQMVKELSLKYNLDQ